MAAAATPEILAILATTAIRATTATLVIPAEVVEAEVVEAEAVAPP